MAALRATATRHATPYGDGSIVWHSWGPAHSNLPPVVLLHGGSGSWTHWVRNIQPLVDSGRQVWAPDLPGFGDSALPPDGKDADVMAAPLNAALQQLLGPQAVDLVGFSFGGMVAGLWAADFPARVARLVVVSAVGLGLVARNTVRLKAWRHLATEEARDAAHHHNLVALMLRPGQTVHPDTLALHKANVLRDRLPARRLSNTAVLAQCLHRAQCPVSAIYGREDALYTGYLDALQATLHAVPRLQSLHLLEQAGHWVQYDRAESFNATLLPLLSP